MARHHENRAGDEQHLRRIADMLFVEMFPDHEFAPLFKGLASPEIVEDLRALLRVLLAERPPEKASDLAGLCPVLTARPLDAALRLRFARLFVDCAVDARLPAPATLEALDRLHTALHAGIEASASDPTRETTRSGQGHRWTRPQLRATSRDLSRP